MKKLLKALKKLLTPNHDYCYPDWETRRYLSQATDIYDLERRQREIEYGGHPPHYLYCPRRW
jgi:hypothetical protein